MSSFLKWWQQSLRTAVILVVVLTPSATRSGDLLRGGAPANSRTAPGNNGATSATIDQSRAQYQDHMARTSRAIQSVRNLQNQARQNAAIKGVNNLGQGLPVVRDGLGFGGLDYIGKKAGYDNASDDPVQTRGTDGRFNVTIRQKLQQAFLQWKTFNVGRGTTVIFDQSLGGREVGKWIAFNEVLDPTGVPSQIMGQIKAAGQVYIINQNGIIFGGTSQVNTHTLVASSLPINTNLVQRGLLNNPDNQFLFSALKINQGASTPEFTPPPPPGGAIGDIVVQAGATLTAPTSPSKVGGRIMLVGPNVTNNGTIYTPDGQTILAAGLEVGIAAHNSSDPSIRGLDIFVGKTSDPTVATVSAVTGIASNRGMISIPRGNLTMVGRVVEQMGAVSGTTSVSLNSSVRLDASYDSVPNVPNNAVNTSAFLKKSTGTVRIGAGSVIEILPDAGAEKIVGTELALPTKVDIIGKAIHLGPNSTLLAPNARVTISAGVYNFIAAGNQSDSKFVRTQGQVYLDRNAVINVAGTGGATAPVTQNILTLQLRGAEFADSPFNRTSPVRGVDITLDIRRQGTYNGFAWVGTPLADASGFVGLIERTASELTTAGGSVNISAGSSVVMQPGSVIDVSGGWTNYTGGLVKTTRVMYRNYIFDIADATPDRVYDGIYTGEITVNHPRWGITRTYHVPFMSGEHYEPGYVYGGAGGTIDISSPSMALDGTLRGATVNGPRQRDLPAQPSTLNLTFQGDQISPDGREAIPFNPHPPNIVLQSGVTQRPANPFTLDSLGNPSELREDRKRLVVLSPEEMEQGGFGFIKVNNPDGNVTLVAGETIRTPALGSVELSGSNVNVFGSIISPGGSIVLNAYNISPTVYELLERLSENNPNLVTPAPNAGRGIVTLGPAARLDASGLLVDDRLSAPSPLSLPIVLGGGSVGINGYTVNLSRGSIVDVSGGARIDWMNSRTYGDAGAITIAAGRDLNIPGVLGGKLTLGSTLRGFAGPSQKGGTLAIQAPFIQIGGASANPNVLVLQPSFFNQGGFSSFALTGVGNRTDQSRTPGIFITPGTEIKPVPQSHIIVPFGGGKDGLVLKQVVYPEAMRSPVSLSFAAPTTKETYIPAGTAAVLVRGDIVMGEGALIDTATLGNVSFKGGTVALFGDVFAPGGTIAVAGATNGSSIFANNPSLVPTVYIGPNSTLSTAGKARFIVDPYGRRIGSVLPGGSISITGNIILEAGSVLDVSGASAELDIAPAYLGMTSNLDPVIDLLKVPASSGLTTRQFGWFTVPTTIDSNGGLISLAGGEMLLSRATLRGEAGGPTAVGGTLLVSSGRFYVGVPPTPSDLNLHVTQSGSNFPTTFFPGGVNPVGKLYPMFGNAGAFANGGGYFGVNDFQRGGFDNLQLGGNVEFNGPVSINARGALSVATGGFIYADSVVQLTAPYVGLGTAFRPPFQFGFPDDPPFSFQGLPYLFAPTSGPGRLIVRADLIDVGNLTLNGIGNTSLIADGGSIRGNGNFSMAGNLYMRSAQIYPTSGSAFSVFVYDPAQGVKGTITIDRSGTVSLPMSAGGTLNIYASEIVQGGVLRAPFGTINLGWDGTGTAPVNAAVGNLLATPVTENLTLRAGSVTSVSAIDPITGQPALIPYGRYNPDDGTWIAPNGQNVTVSGLPQKAINIGGRNIDSQAGSLIDIRGGGDLYAYNWSPGLLGSRDLLGTASENWSADQQYQTGDLVFFGGRTWSARQSNVGRSPSTGFFWTPLPEAYAVLPSYSEFFQPFAAFNLQASTLLGDPGYTSSYGLRAGDQIYFGTSGAGLPSGSYTLLPPRYALLPGAYLVTPVTGLPIGTWTLPDGGQYVNGYRYNGLNSQRELQPIYSRWEVLSGTTLRNRAGYTDFFANTFIPEYARENNISVQRLPQDSGHLVLAAVTSMNLDGRVLTRPVGPGRGGSVDIASAAPIIIGNALTPDQPGSLVLDARQLSSFGAESLLIGGTRTFGSDFTTINARTTNITVTNAGAPLTGPEIILVSKVEYTGPPGNQVEKAGTGRIQLDSTAVIRQVGSLSGPADTLVVNGAGALLRVSSDFSAETLRTGVTAPSGVGGLRLDGQATVTGTSLTLDSTSLLDRIQDSATVSGRAVTINSGIVRLLFSGASPGGNGLVLGSAVIGQISQADSLSLLTYSTLDIYGLGTLGSAGLDNLAIHAAAIRRQAGSGFAGFEARNILLDNSANISVPAADLAGALGGTLQFNSQRLTLGANRVEIAKFQNLELTATAGIYLKGSGSLNMPGNITGNSPFIVATTGSSSQNITAGGAVTFNDSPGLSPARTAVGLGSTIAISGTTLTMNSDIIMPSGQISLTGTAGPLSVGGNLDVGGIAKTLYDVTRYTNGGVINLSATAGDLTVGPASTINVSAPTGGGNAGALNVSVPGGAFNLNGALLGQAGTGGLGGSFSLDVGSLSTLSTIGNDLTTAGFNNALAFRVRDNDVTIDGTTVARDFRLSADQGAITVTGIVNVSGTTAGSIRLSGAEGVVLAANSELNASAETYNSAGKGGDIFIETRGIVDGSNDGQINIATNSSIKLGVTETAALGEFSGTLHLRAPQNGAFNDLLIKEINGSVTGASSIIAEGFRVYSYSNANTQLESVAPDIFTDGQAFGAFSGAIENRLLIGNAGLSAPLTVRVGAEISNTLGDLTLGSSANGLTNWDLSTFRFGPDSAPGVLTLRAKGDINFYGALSDGFQSAAYNAELLNASAVLPLNAQSWSYRIAAGADTTAADALQVLSLSALTADKGHVQVGRFVDFDGGGSGASAQTSAALSGYYQVIRTGSGNIDIATGRDVRLLNHFATIYTAGTRVADPTMGGTFDVPNPVLTSTPQLGNAQQNPAYAPQYSLGGGNISIDAKGNIGHFKRDVSQLGTVLIADSNLQMPTNWLYRRGYVGDSGAFETVSVGTDVASTTWWIDFSNFFQGIGALGGGNIRMMAGGTVSNVDAVIPTNARMPKTSRDLDDLVELGGGDLTIRAGGDLDAGVYYVEKGKANIEVGGSIVTNATRRLARADAASSTFMPTTLFVGKGSFKIDARGDVLLGPVSNPFLLPGGINNSVYYKTYFTTFSTDSGVEVTSTGGDIKFQTVSTIAGSQQQRSILAAYYQDILQFASANPSSTKPWLRLNETSSIPFNTVSSIGASSLRLTALSGDVNLAGSYNLFPSPTGNLSIEAAGAVNALQPIGTSTNASLGVPQIIWSYASFNLSDANPNLVSNAASPVAYLNSFDNKAPGNGQALTASNELFLANITTPFAETGSLTTSVSTQQALHASGLLHRNDPTPLRVYAGTGDISGLQLYSPKESLIVAGRDISDVSFYLQNLSEDDLSIVSAGRNLLPYNQSSILRTLATTPASSGQLGNFIVSGLGVRDGDLSIGGPGTLEVLAGGDIRLGNGPSDPDGTGAGIVSIGNARNPYLGLDGSSLIVAAGLGGSFGLSNSQLDFDAFIDKFIKGADGERYLSALAASSDIDVSSVSEFEALSDEEQKRVALQAFFMVLRESGRDKNLAGSPTFGTYSAGLEAIDTLFPGTYNGDILTNTRDIRTKSGGDISLLIPGGKLVLQTQQSGSRLIPPGIVTETGGNIHIFTDQGVDIGISRIFTLRGGNQIIWASTGDIAAGSSSKTVQSAPPTRVIIDPTSADVATDLAGLATGGGIGVLATVAGVPPGSVDLIAVTGNVDAGDAGIRATGNLNIAAVQVLNANNIAVGGASTGTPSAPAVTVPNIAAASQGSTAAAAGTQAAAQNNAPREEAPVPKTDDALSVITVEVLGYGGGEEEEDEEERKRKKKLEEALQP